MNFSFSKTWKNSKSLQYRPDIDGLSAGKKLMWRSKCKLSVLTGLSMNQIFLQNGYDK